MVMKSMKLNWIVCLFINLFFRHIKTIEALKPDIFEILADTDTYSANGIAEKRASKAVDRSLNYLEKSIELIDASEVLKDSPFFVHIAGGYNKKQREKSIAAAKESKCSGYVLSGISPTGPPLEGFDFSTTKAVITETIEALKTPCKVNVFPGPLSPYEVIDLVEAGIDMFDTSLPFVATERGCALVFCNRTDPSKYSQNRDTTCPPKETPSLIPKDESVKDDASRGYEIDLTLEEFRDDFQPISSMCECYTCRKYSKAYINHLLTVKELLGPILLMMHNLHHYMKFFESIRHCLKEDCLSDLKTAVMNTI